MVMVPKFQLLLAYSFNLQLILIAFVHSSHFKRSSALNSFYNILKSNNLYVILLMQVANGFKNLKKVGFCSIYNVSSKL